MPSGCWGFTATSRSSIVVPEYDAERRALLARNAYHVEFGEAVAFVAASEGLHGLTADRTEFLGRRGSYQLAGCLCSVSAWPVQLRAGLDPCAALQVHINLEPNARCKRSTFCWARARTAKRVWHSSIVIATPRR
jgi:cellobiose phosphorylase